VGAIAAANDAVADAMPAAMNGDAATKGRRIGMAIGVFSAIFGGGSCEPIEASIDRYRTFRDAGQMIGASHDLRKAAEEGAQHGAQFDQQMVQLKQIDGIDINRPAPYVLDVRFTGDQQPLDAIVNVVRSGDERYLIVEGKDAASVRGALIDRGIRASRVEANDDGRELRIRIVFE